MNLIRVLRHILAGAFSLNLITIAAHARGDDDPYEDVVDAGVGIVDAGVDIYDEADILFKEGLALMKEGKVDAACTKFDQSFKLEPRAGVLYMLATCRAKQGRLATAVAQFKQFIAMVNLHTSLNQLRYKGRKEIAEKQCIDLAPLVPHLALTLPPEAPWTTSVKLDGATIELGALSAPLEIDPGPHVIVAQVPGGKASELRFSLEKAEKKQLALPVELLTKPCTSPVSPSAADKAAPMSTGCAGCEIGSDRSSDAAGVLTGIFVLAGLVRRRKGSRAPSFRRHE